MPSRPRQSSALLDALLGDDDPVGIEAAIARLAIIGRPALRHVLQRLDGADAMHLPRLLRVMERIGDGSGLAPARRLLAHESPDVAAAAVDALGALLDARDASVASSALDALTATLLDADRPDQVRLRAFDAIAGAADRSATYDADVLEPLRQQLRRDRSTALQQAAAGARPQSKGPSPHSRASLEAFANGESTLTPDALRQLITGEGANAPLTVLHRAIERIRMTESAASGEDLDAWRVARATAHHALSHRGSRLAVYDLRETLEALGAQTPVGMLSALQQVGDASVLEALADAHAGTTNAWFRGQLVTIFRAIVAREKVTKRHAAIKKIAARAPATIEELWG